MDCIERGLRVGECLQSMVSKIQKNYWIEKIFPYIYNPSHHLVQVFKDLETYLFLWGIEIIHNAVIRSHFTNIS